MKHLFFLLFLVSSLAYGQQPARETFPSQNYIINGDMTFNQRGPVTSIASGAYYMDRFQYAKSGTTAVHNAGPGIDFPTFAQSGHKSSSCGTLTLTTADSSMDAGDFAMVIHTIEGYNYAQFYGKPFTLSFWVKHTLPGTYSVRFRAKDNTAVYITTYTVNASETWEKKVITVPVPTIATNSDFTNGAGLEISWVIMVGSTYQTSTLNTWQTGALIGANTQVNGVANTGTATYFRLAQVMLNSGSSAAPFTLAKSYDLDVSPGTSSIGTAYQWFGRAHTSSSCDPLSNITFRAQKRTSTYTPAAYAYGGGSSGFLGWATAAGSVCNSSSAVGAASYKSTSGFGGWYSSGGASGCTFTTGQVCLAIGHWVVDNEF